MGDEQPYIKLTLDTDRPIEMSAFVGAFTAIADEFEHFVRTTRPDIDPEATLYVSEVRKGSIEAILLPMAVGALPLIENVNTVAEFVRNFGSALELYLRPRRQLKDTTAAQLENFLDQTRAIAADPDASLEAAAIEIKDGKKSTKAAFKFSSKEARAISENVQQHRRELEQLSSADQKRVLMLFTRTDVGDAKLGKRSGERVVIDSVSKRSLPVIYASAMAEQKIRHEVRDEPDNIYKKGFVVDVNVETRRLRPVAYRITDVHQIVELPDEDD
jgi:hypothetical protein